MQFKILVRGIFLCLLVLLGIKSPGASAWDKRASSALSHYIMAVMYDDLGDFKQAIGAYQDALKADYQNSTIHQGLAYTYIKNNELDKSVEELNLAVKFNPQAVEPHAILAVVYYSQNRNDLATSEYEIALQNASRLHPENINIYRNLGSIYLQQKKFKEAQSIYQLILKLSPLDASAHFYLGSTYYEQKNLPQAEAQLLRALELNPDYHEALNFLGYLYVEENRNLHTAEEMILRALKLQPDNGAYVDSLGWLYFKQGRIQEALKELQRASILLEDPIIYDHLADTYLATGDTEKAKSNWEKSLQLDASQDKVKKKIEQLKEKKGKAQ